MNRSDPTGHGEDPLPDPSPAVEPPEETPEEQLEQDVEDYLDDPEAGPAPAGGFEELQKKLKGQEEGGTPVPPTLPLPPVEYPPFGPGGLESIDLTVPFFPPPPPPPDIPDLPEPDLGPPSLFGWTFEGGSGVSKLFDWFRIIIGPPMEPAVPDPDAPPLGIQIGVTIVVDF